MKDFKNLREKAPKEVDNFIINKVIPLCSRWDSPALIEDSVFLFAYNNDYHMVYVLESDQGKYKCVKLNALEYIKSGNLDMLSYIVQYSTRMGRITAVQDKAELEAEKENLLQMMNNAPFFRHYVQSKISKTIFKVPMFELIDIVKGFRKLVAYIGA